MPEKKEPSRYKAYRGVYSMIYRKTVPYLSHAPMIWFGRLTDDLLAGYEQYKDFPGFPGGFYIGISNAILHWCLDNFRDCNGNKDLNDALQAAWDFHKKYLQTDTLTESDLNDAADNAAEVVSKSLFPITRELCAAVLMDLRDAWNAATEAGESA